MNHLTDRNYTKLFIQESIAGDHGTITAAERAQFEKLKTNTAAKEKLLGLVKAPADGILASQVEVVVFLGRVGWVTAAEKKQLFTRLVGPMIPRNRNLSKEELNRVWSLQAEMDLPLEVLPMVPWDKNTIDAIVLGMRNQDTGVLLRLLQLSDPSNPVSSSSSNGLSLVLSRDLQVLESVSDFMLKKSVDAFNSNNLLRKFFEILQTDPKSVSSKIRADIGKAAVKFGQQGKFPSEFLETTKVFGLKDKNYQAGMVAMMKNGRHIDDRDEGYRGLEELLRQNIRLEPFAEKAMDAFRDDERNRY